MSSFVGERFILWGARGHARVLRSVIESLGGSVVALVDNDPEALEGLNDAEPLHGLQALEAFVYTNSKRSFLGAVAVGGGRSADRLSILQTFNSLGISTPAIIDRSAVQEAGSTVREGSQLLAGAVLGAGAKIGAGCILNHRAVVDHECDVADGVHIAPGAVLCGCVLVEEGAFLGAGCTVLPRVSIGAYATVAAGAVVIRDVVPGQVVAGVPAKPLVPKDGAKTK